MRLTGNISLIILYLTFSECNAVSKNYLYLNYTSLEADAVEDGVPQLFLSSQPGDPCGDTSNCTKSSGLICIEGNCQCKNGETWQDSHSQCLLKIGKDCNPKDQNGCIQNSICEFNTQRCACSAGFIATQNDTNCLLEGKFGYECESDQNCISKTKSMICVNGRCGCDPDQTRYQSARRNSWREDQGDGCVGLDTQPCVQDMCTDHAECTNAKICKCTYGYKSDGNGICLGLLDSPCPCAEGFICMGGHCECALHHLQFYSIAEKKCFSYVGSPCDESVGLYCADNAKCVSSVCECPDHMVESVGGKCEIKFGNECTVDSNITTNVQCDSLAGLHCKHGVCSCVTGSIYEEKERRCAMPIGYRCEDKDSHRIPCISGAECVKGHPRLGGRCRCRNGHVFNAVGNNCTLPEEL